MVALCICWYVPMGIIHLQWRPYYVVDTSIPVRGMLLHRQSLARHRLSLLPLLLPLPAELVNR